MGTFAFWLWQGSAHKKLRKKIREVGSKSTANLMDSVTDNKNAEAEVTQQIITIRLLQLQNGLLLIERE